ncbi:hypothetical protein GCM10011531_18100 [Aquaticitalea lipolytica]|jgi:hypothetical protein|uniref:DUF4920 domain-containing protein n=1 Tax=Aquaticitalea lipolytica TaxID=1247562 RepID=A0A8J2TSR3_9FLAO|nr:DUF4920 domain-containing protein [Aquaticitalea lipolytica]GFZ87240.1 hypothetical protein GCM10011531_18100 [Aquaticitalea lipolytica]
MKKIVSILAITLALVSCKDNDKKPETQEIEKQEVNYTSVGMEINDADALPAARMAEHYKAMKVGDTVNSKMIGKVEEVCQSKGCWMKVDLENGEQVMVKFKDYAFFMPKDLAGKEVVLNGKAFVNEVPVDEQRHYAEDGGATPEEIAAITAPKKTFSFEADGVLIKQ